VEESSSFGVRTRSAEGVDSEAVLQPEIQETGCTYKFRIQSEVQFIVIR
jgi:hypothetical protein